MDNRFNQLLLYLEKQKISTKNLVAIRSDASFRKYYRLENNILVMDAAPEKGESVSKFSEIATILHSFNYGSIDFFLVVPLILGSIVGVQLGQKLGQYLDSNQLKSLFALLLCSVAIAIGYDTFFRDQSKLINEQQVTNTDLNKYAEFSLKLSNDFPFLYGAFEIILAIALGILAAWMRKLISDFRKKKPKEEVKFPVK